MEAKSQLEVPTRLRIGVVGATGTGPTSLAAFDDALRAVGVANFNLIRLSSVIPPGSRVTAGSRGAARREGEGSAEVVDLRESNGSRIQGGWGDRLYAVWAFASAELLGQEAWAGIAWAQDPEDGRGLFVEHEGGSESQVRKELDASLESICASRGLGHLEHHQVVVGARCEGSPVGALVIAPFLSEPWAAAGAAG